MKRNGGDFLGIILVTFVVGVIISFITGTNIFRPGTATNSGLSELSSLVNSSSTPTTPKNSEFEVAGWIPDWASKEGLDSINTNGDTLTNISPVWYEAQADGTLKNKTPKNAKEIIDSANTHGLSITPSIALFDHEILTSIFSDPAKLQTHINQIVEAGSQPGMHGIDIDYESTKLSDKDGFFALLKGVHDGLNAKGKKLIVTVVPQWGNDIRYLSLIETRQVQDWTKISEFADEIRLMAYDYTWQGATFAGPIAPLNWQEQVIQFALTKVSPDKLVLGIPLYSYEKYIEKDEAGPYRQDLLPFLANWEANLGEKNDSRAYTYSTVQKILRENQITSREEYQGEQVIRYSKFNADSGKFEDRVTVYIDQNGVNQRAALAKKYKLRGVAFWRLGNEEDLLKTI